MIMISVLVPLAIPVQVGPVEYRARKKYVYAVKLNPKVLEYNKC